MLPDEKRIMEEMLSLAKENNQILRSWRRGQRWHLLWSVVWWLAIVGLTLWSYYQLQPQIEKATGYLNSVLPMIQSLRQ
jgi:hypothetical protein